MSIRVVVADDHTLVREGIRKILEQAGDVVVVGEAADGEEAVRVVAELKPDVLLLDISMPRLSGVESAHRIRIREPATAILVLSAFDDDARVFAMLSDGVAGYILKSAHGDELLAAVRAVHAGELVLCPSVARKALAHVTRRGTHQGGREEALTDREREVLTWMARGLTNRAIARELSLSPATVKTHVAHIFEKLGAESRTEAVTRYMKQGVLRLEEIP